MGKNFSCNQIREKRADNDGYPTPYSLTRHLLMREVFPEHVLEPACGDGAIVRILHEYGFPEITAYDKYCGNDSERRDFFAEDRVFPALITNPPLRLATEFILKAREVCAVKFALLLPLSYLHGQYRYERIYSDRDEFPLHRVHVFTRYPHLGGPLREDGRYGTGMMVWAWFVWNRAYHGLPVLDWIDNNADVLKKGD